MEADQEGSPLAGVGEMMAIVEVLGLDIGGTKCGRYLGMGLSVPIDILNPQIIVAGSVFQRAQNLLCSLQFRRL